MIVLSADQALYHSSVDMVSRAQIKASATSFDGGSMLEVLSPMSVVFSARLCSGLLLA
jgi:hypothetical protein